MNENFGNKQSYAESTIGLSIVASDHKLEEVLSIVLLKIIKPMSPHAEQLVLPSRNNCFQTELFTVLQRRVEYINAIITVFLFGECRRHDIPSLSTCHSIEQRGLLKSYSVNEALRISKVNKTFARVNNHFATVFSLFNGK